MKWAGAFLPPYRGIFCSFWCHFCPIPPLISDSALYALHWEHFSLKNNVTKYLVNYYDATQMVCKCYRFPRQPVVLDKWTAILPHSLAHLCKYIFNLWKNRCYFWRKTFPLKEVIFILIELLNINVWSLLQFVAFSWGKPNHKSRLYSIPFKECLAGLSLSKVSIFFGEQTKTS